MTRLVSIGMTESYGNSISSLSAEVGLPIGRRGSRIRRGMLAIWPRALTSTHSALFLSNKSGPRPLDRSSATGSASEHRVRLPTGALQQRATHK
jgi:hypothetical protein